jgi:hypothetical protein
MKRLSFYIIVFALGFLAFMFYSNNYIHISLVNDASSDELEISYSIDDRPEQIRIVESFYIPFEFNVHKTSFGKHTIRVAYKELNISETIEVFTFKNNYVSFELQNLPRGKPEISTRYSMWPLVYT